MHYNQLGVTDLKVSKVCLGTMTFGEQNSEAEAFEQMDAARAAQVNFFDTAELYSIPPKAETQGSTETIIGNWIKSRGCREKIVLATKVVGRSSMDWFRGEESRLSRNHIRQAIAGSLARLQTDYVDLYQLHWPDRRVPLFGSANRFSEVKSDEVALAETLSALYELVDEGKVRHIGVSNETAWGVHEALRLAGLSNRQPIVSIQNAYSLVNRTFEQGLAEFSMRSKVGLLAYSPLAQGYLTGKYRNGELPKNSRKELFGRMGRYESERGLKAIEAYYQLASSWGMSLLELAQAFVMSRPFLTSNIIGATTLSQLEDNLKACELTLSPEQLQAIESIHMNNPNPSP
ncbi:aldo/keto reductase [uncultured Umboniibacter sp.]|uniref:aldo/keto reductase n=1 Tax=uncultured Umboniibacter sp. TaxID=1798917 RepID=UPI002622E2C8|nr:aldo/keto reductase [uncultured Umboniibacter sp.]